MKNQTVKQHLGKQQEMEKQNGNDRKRSVGGLRRVGRWAAAFLLAGFLAGASFGTPGMDRVNAAQTIQTQAAVLELDKLPLTTDNAQRLDFTINAGNVSKYNNAVLTGSFSDEDGNIARKRIVIDGTTVNLTIRDVNIDRNAWYATTAAIELINGAKLNLTLEGNNVLKGSIGGAGIGVGEDCTLTITAQCTGTLTAVGGSYYGGAAGIGANGTGAYQGKPREVIQKFGTIIIEGGTVNAEGGTYSYKGVLESSGAGIGGSGYGSEGTIIIRGGVVNAVGGTGAAGIGGGCAGHVDKIEITGGKVTASAMGDKTNSAIQGAAIGSGYNGNSKEALPCGEISITGGEITADGNIGYGTGGNEYDGGNLRISGEAKLDVSGTISCKNTVGVAYTLQLTVYDLKLVGNQNIPGTAELKNQKKTTTCTVAGASAAIELEYFAESALTGKQDVKVTLGADVYQTQVDFQEGRTDYTVQIGQPLCDTRLRLDIDWNWKTKTRKVIALSVRQAGKELGSQEYYAGETTECPESRDYLYVQMYLPEGEQYDITAAIEDVNGGEPVTVSGQMVKSDVENMLYVLPLNVELTDVDSTDNLAEVTVSGKKDIKVYYLVSGSELTDAEVQEKAGAGETESLTLTGGTQTFSVAASDVETDVTCYVIAKGSNGYSAVYRQSFHSGKMAAVKAMLYKCGETEGIAYATLDAAVAAAQKPENAGCTVRLQADMTHSGTLTVNGGSFTLDVNGKQLTEENGTTLLQLNGGSLTLKDSVGTGSMVGGKRVGNTVAHMIVANGGTLTIQNGNYWVDGSGKEADRGAVIYTAEGANPVVKIKEGSFGRKLQCSKYGFYMLSGTLEVEGGTFSNIWNYAIKSAKATISEGEFQDNLYLNQDNVKLRGGIFSSIYVADDEGEIAPNGDCTKLLDGEYGKNYQYYKKDTKGQYSKPLDKKAANGNSLLNVKVFCLLKELKGSAAISVKSASGSIRQPMVGDTLQCTFTPESGMTEWDEIKEPAYNWYRVDGEEATLVETKTGRFEDTYDVTADDLGKTLYCEVTAANYQKSVRSELKGPVTKYSLNNINTLFKNTVTKYYTGEPVTLTAEDFADAGVGGNNNLNLQVDTDFVVQRYENNIEVGEATVWVEGIGDYIGSTQNRFDIVYMPMYVTPTVKGLGADGWTNCAELAAPEGYTISFSRKAGYAASIFYDTETGEDGVQPTYYLRETATGYISDAKQLEDVIKVEKEAPVFTGESDGISFGLSNWKEREKPISFEIETKTAQMAIHVTDALSGIQTYYYYADRVQDTANYQVLTDYQLLELERNFKEAENGRFTLDTDGSYVVYAYAVDKAGNQSAVICSDGIVIDNTAPGLAAAVPAEKIKANTADVEFTMDEAGTLYYYYCDGNSALGLNATPTFEELENHKGAFDEHFRYGTVSVSENQVGQKQSISLEKLYYDTKYAVYLVAKDETDNISQVQRLNFSTIELQDLQVQGNVEIDGSNELTYGQKLSVLPLKFDGTVYGMNSREIPGSFEWLEPESVPTVGTTSAAYTYRHSEPDSYRTYQNKIAITVVPAALRVTAPVLAKGVTITYDQTKTLGEVAPMSNYVPAGGSAAGSVWTGGSAVWTVGDNEVTVDGSWSWENPDIVPTVDNEGYVAVFTPTDHVNYKPTTAVVTLSLGKATPEITEKPTAAAITYGQTLAESQLSGGAGNVAGIFAWKDGSVRPTVSDGDATPYEVVFTSTDSNWGKAETTVTLTVDKASCPSNMPQTKMEPAHRVKTVGEVELPQGWYWEEADALLELTDETAVTATAVYNGSDKGNYETESVEIVLIRSICEHAQTAVNGMREATCQAEGYTGDTVCTECGVTLLVGTAIPKTEHRFTSAVTKEATTQEEGILTYVCGACGYSYTEAIAKLAPTPKPEDHTTPDAAPTETPAATPAPTAAPAATTAPTAAPASKPATTPIPVPATEPTVTPVPDTEMPYLKNDTGKNSWELIAEQLENAPDREIIDVEMNGTTMVPGDIFDTIKGRDVTVVFHMGDGITWTVNGRDVTAAGKNIDLGVVFGGEAGKTIPVEIINNVTGERYSVNLTLAYDGEFGFRATLTVNMDKKNAGFFANLFYYNEQSGELEFICAGEIDSQGEVGLTFTHASDYTIIVDRQSMEPGVVENPVNPASAEEISTAGSFHPVRVLLMALAVIILGAAGILLVVVRNKTEK